MAEVGSLFVRLRADASEFEQTMSGISGSIEGAGKSIQGTGKDLTKSVTAPLVGVATAALGVGMGFDDGMAKVRAISGATGEDFELLRNTAMELGSTTRFSASEAAEGLQFLALAGWDANEMADGLGGVLSLASASGMDLGRTADIVTDTMSAFGIEAADSSLVADMFATASANSNTSVEQLGSALGRAGPVLAGLGIGLDETQTALGLMADQGLKGGRAGTALSAIMRDLTANAEDGTVSFGDFDVAIYDSEGNMRDFGDILADVEGGLEGMSQEQRQAALTSVFQQQALQGINPLLSEGSDRYNELRDSIVNSEGASADMAATMEDTLGGSLRALKSQFEGIMIQLSDALLPVIRGQVIPVIEQFAGFISDLIERFSNLDARTQTIILAIAGLAAALGPVLIAIGTLMIVLAPVVGLIGALISPVGLVVIAIGLLAAALVLAYRESETFRNIVDTVVSFVRDVAVAAFELISDRLREFGERVIPELIETWNVLKDAVTTAVNFIWDSVIQPVFSAIAGFISEHSETIEAVLTGVWEIIKSTVSTAVDVIEGVIVAFLAVIRGDWETAWDAIKGVVDSVWDHIKTVVGNMRDFVVEAISRLASRSWDAIKDLGSDIIGVFSDMYDGVKGFAGDLRDTVVGFVSDMVDSVIGFFGDLFSGVLGILEEMFPETYALLEGWIGDSISAVSGFVSDFVGFISDLKSDVTSFVSDMASEVVSLIVNMASEAWTTVSGFVSDVTGAFSELYSVVSGYVSDIYSAVTSSIADMASEAWSTVSSFVSDVTGAFSDLYSEVSTFVSNLYSDVTGFISDMASEAFSTITGFVSDTIGEFDSMVAEVLSIVGRLPGEIKDFFSDAGSWLIQAGKDIIGGLVSGIRDAIPDVRSELSGVTDLVPDWKGPPVKDRKLLQPAGELIMQGLEGGIEKRASDVQRTLSRLTSDISATGTASAGGSNGMARSANSGNGTIVIHNEMGGEHIETLILDVLSGQMRKVH